MLKKLRKTIQMTSLYNYTIIEFPNSNKSIIDICMIGSKHKIMLPVQINGKNTMELVTVSGVSLTSIHNLWKYLCINKPLLPYEISIKIFYASGKNVCGG